jgi:hypothetical protein
MKSNQSIQSRWAAAPSQGTALGVEWVGRIELGEDGIDVLGGGAGLCGEQLQDGLLDGRTHVCERLDGRGGIVVEEIVLGHVRAEDCGCVAIGLNRGLGRGGSAGTG